MLVRIIYTIINNIEKGESIAQYLIENKLAACVNIIHNVKSFYMWDNKLQKDDEYIILIKTSDNIMNKTIEALKKIHTYDTPAIIEITNGKYCDPKFEKWVSEYVDH